MERNKTNIREHVVKRDGVLLEARWRFQYSHDQEEHRPDKTVYQRAVYLVEILSMVVTFGTPERCWTVYGEQVEKLMLGLQVLAKKNSRFQTGGKERWNKFLQSLDLDGTYPTTTTERAEAVYAVGEFNNHLIHTVMDECNALLKERGGPGREWGDPIIDLL